MPKRSILESKDNMWDRAIENRKSEPKSKPESNKVPRLLPILEGPILSHVIPSCTYESIYPLHKDKDRFSI